MKLTPYLMTCHVLSLLQPTPPVCISAFWQARCAVLGLRENAHAAVSPDLSGSLERVLFIRGEGLGWSGVLVCVPCCWHTGLQIFLAATHLLSSKLPPPPADMLCCAAAVALLFRCDVHL